VTPELVLVVPCYNEASRLDPEAFVRFVTTHADVRIVLVDDGSSDGTGAMLERIRLSAPASVATLRHARNRGKAEAVRAGILAALAMQPRVIGFFDADLSAPLQAVDDFLALLRTRPAVDLVLGSRVMLMGRDIRRRTARHYLGRVFATAVSHALDLPVYDTQCGAKMLRVNADTASLFERPFQSRWVFDVELIARYLRLPAAPGEPSRRDRIYELVLPAWHDRPGSKVRWVDVPRAMVDLARIWRERLAHVPPRRRTAAAFGES
jgi:glycosyltransferase involved in cell wall biosynthesis